MARSLSMVFCLFYAGLWVLAPAVDSASPFLIRVKRNESNVSDVETSPSSEVGEASSRFYGLGGQAVPGVFPPSLYQPGHPYDGVQGGLPYPGNSIYPQQSYPPVNNYYGGPGLGGGAVGRPPPSQYPALTPLGAVNPYPPPVGQQSSYLNPYGPGGGASGLYGPQYPGTSPQSPYLNNPLYGNGGGLGAGYPYPSVGHQQPPYQSQYGPGIGTAAALGPYAPQNSAPFYPSSSYPSSSYNPSYPSNSYPSSSYNPSYPSNSYPTSSYNPSYYPSNSYSPSITSYPSSSGAYPYRPVSPSSAAQTPYKPSKPSAIPDPFSYPDTGSSYYNQGSSYPGKPTVIELPAGPGSKPYDTVILQSPSTSYRPSVPSQSPYNNPYSPSSSGYPQAAPYRPVIQASIQEISDDTPVYYPTGNKPREASKVTFPSD